MCNIGHGKNIVNGRKELPWKGHRKVPGGEACTKRIGTGYPRRTEAKITRRTKEKFWPINAGNSNASKINGLVSLSD